MKPRYTIFAAKGQVQGVHKLRLEVHVVQADRPCVQDTDKLGEECSPQELQSSQHLTHSLTLEEAELDCFRSKAVQDGHEAQ